MRNSKVLSARFCRSAASLLEWNKQNRIKHKWNPYLCSMHVRTHDLIIATNKFSPIIMWRVFRPFVSHFNLRTLNKSAIFAGTHDFSLTSLCICRMLLIAMCHMESTANNICSMWCTVGLIPLSHFCIHVWNAKVMTASSPSPRYRRWDALHQKIHVWNKVPFGKW